MNKTGRSFRERVIPAGLPNATILLVFLFAACLVLTLIFELNSVDGYASRGRGVPLDDSWIHFVYAHSLGTSLRLDYNPGQSESGFSSLLWVILLAPGALLRIPPPLFAKLLGLAAHFACAGLVFAILHRRGSKPIAFAAALVVAADPLMVFASMSGMETVPYALAILLCVRAQTQGRRRFLGFALAACVLARPDGAVMVALAWLGLLVDRAMGRKARGSLSVTPADWVWILGLPIAAGGAWMAYNHAATGHLFPTSYYARAEGLPAVFNARALAVLNLGLRETFPRLPGLFSIALILAGLLAIVQDRHRARFLPLILFPPVLALLMGGRMVEVIGGTFPGNRYLVPIFPLLVLMAGRGGQGIVALVRHQRPSWKKAALGMEFLMALGLIVSLAGGPTTYVERTRFLKENFAAMSSDIHFMQEAFGKWVQDNVPKDAGVCTFDAGAIRYFGERHTVDILGLNTAGFPPQNPAEVRRQCRWLITYPKHSRRLLAHLSVPEVHRIDRPDNRAGADRLMAAYDLSRVASGK